MAALTGARLMVRYGDSVNPQLGSMGVKAGVSVFTGAIVVNNGGVLDRATTSSTIVCLGVAVETQINSGADNAKRCEYRAGCYPFANSSAGDLIAETERGKNVFLVDDQTVAKTDGGATRAIAGKVAKVENGLVFVTVGV